MLWARAGVKIASSPQRPADLVRGQLLQVVIPALAGTASSGGFDIAAAAGQAVGGGVTGAIVTAIVGLIKNALLKKA